MPEPISRFRVRGRIGSRFASILTKRCEMVLALLSERTQAVEPRAHLPWLSLKLSLVERLAELGPFSTRDKDARLKAIAFSAAFHIGDYKMRDQTLAVALATFLLVNSVGSVSAQVGSPELDACRSTGLIALKEHNPSIKDVSFDIDGMTIAKANTKVEDTVIKTIVIGDAYLEKGKKDTRRTFLCLIGEKGKVVLTFFTDK
jgi:hypothetical protein